MKIVYVANTRIPTEMAHGLQMMKMCESFARSEVRGSKFEVELIVPKRLSISNLGKKDPFDYYRE